MEGCIHADQNTLTTEPTAICAQSICAAIDTSEVDTQACSCMLHLNGELLLLAPESSPHIGLQSTRGSFLKQPHQQGIAGGPCQVLGELLEQDSQIIVHAHHTRLCLGFLSE